MGFAEGFRPIIPDPLSVRNATDDELEQIARPPDDPDALRIFRAQELINLFQESYESNGDGFTYRKGRFMATVYRVESPYGWLAAPVQDVSGQEARVGLHIDVRFEEGGESCHFSSGLTVTGTRYPIFVPEVNVEVLGGSLPTVPRERLQLI